MKGENLNPCKKKVTGKKSQVKKSQATKVTGNKKSQEKMKQDNVSTVIASMFNRHYFNPNPNPNLNPEKSASIKISDRSAVVDKKKNTWI